MILGAGADGGTGRHLDPGPGADPGAPDRRRQAVLAGHRGQVELARSMLGDPSPTVRASALAALFRAGAARDSDLRRGLSDPDPVVRRRACLLGATRPAVALDGALGDADPLVVEAAAWALGERSGARPSTVARLSEVATTHPDERCREAAVAALGAIGDPAGRTAVLAGTLDRRAPVRRRAVMALAPFSGVEVDEALRRAESDRDWQTRQAAEDLRPERG
ncbi:MAG: HEAT repeat domain-containing protein [Acidimicrobiales bacterium]